MSILWCGRSGQILAIDALDYRIRRFFLGVLGHLFWIFSDVHRLFRLAFRVARGSGRFDFLSSHMEDSLLVRL